jgi:hypothetical protein
VKSSGVARQESYKHELRLRQLKRPFPKISS